MTKNMHETEACMLQSKSLKRCDGWEKGKHKSCVCQFRVFSAPATTRYFCVRSQLRFLPSRGIQLDRAAVCYFSSHHCWCCCCCCCYTPLLKGEEKAAEIFLTQTIIFFYWNIWGPHSEYYGEILDFMSTLQEYCYYLWQCDNA